MSGIKSNFIGKALYVVVKKLYSVYDSRENPKVEGDLIIEETIDVVERALIYLLNLSLISCFLFFWYWSGF